MVKRKLLALHRCIGNHTKGCDETPIKQDLRVLPLCNPPGRKDTISSWGPPLRRKLVSAFHYNLKSNPIYFDMALFPLNTLYISGNAIPKSHLCIANLIIYFNIYKYITTKKSQKMGLFCYLTHLKFLMRF